MTVEQLIDALAKMPHQAVVLIEGDTGYNQIGAISRQENGDGMPDEVVLQVAYNDD